MRKFQPVKKALEPARLAGVRQAALPGEIKPCLATLVDEAPASDDWLHEIKIDGYRILARIEDGQVRLVSRNVCRPHGPTSAPTGPFYGG
jgi:ATP-dependent DNA ligase